MLGTLRSSFTSIILLLAVSFSSDRAESAEMKGAVSGAPTVNLRAGAGVDHPLKVTFKEGDRVTVERAEGERFLVAAADGQKEYIHNNLLKLTGATLAQSVADQAPIQKVAAAQANNPAREARAPAAVASATPAMAASQSAPEAKSQSILQMIEGHEAEVKIAALVATIAFVLGWFCGGSYYIRRERKARRKLRF